MIDPLPKGEPYPGGCRRATQWRRVSPAVRLRCDPGPLLLLVILFAASVQTGAVAAVMVVGVWAATAVYVKNRTDRHNAAVDRGEIRVVADPHLHPVPVGALAAPVVDRLATWDTRGRHRTGDRVRRGLDRQTPQSPGRGGGASAMTAASPTLIPAGSTISGPPANTGPDGAGSPPAPEQGRPRGPCRFAGSKRPGAASWWVRNPMFVPDDRLASLIFDYCRWRLALDPVDLDLPGDKAVLDKALAGALGRSRKDPATF